MSQRRSKAKFIMMLTAESLKTKLVEEYIGTARALVAGSTVCPPCSWIVSNSGCLTKGLVSVVIRTSIGAHLWNGVAIMNVRQKYLEYHTKLGSIYGPASST